MAVKVDYDDLMVDGYDYLNFELDIGMQNDKPEMFCDIFELGWKPPPVHTIKLPREYYEAVSKAVVPKQVKRSRGRGRGRTSRATESVVGAQVCHVAENLNILSNKQMSNQAVDLQSMNINQELDLQTKNITEFQPYDLGELSGSNTVESIAQSNAMQTEACHRRILNWLNIQDNNQANLCKQHEQQPRRSAKDKYNLSGQRVVSKSVASSVQDVEGQYEMEDIHVFDSSATNWDRVSDDLTSVSQYRDSEVPQKVYNPSFSSYKLSDVETRQRAENIPPIIRLSSMSRGKLLYRGSDILDLEGQACGDCNPGKSVEMLTRISTNKRAALSSDSSGLGVYMTKHSRGYSDANTGHSNAQTLGNPAVTEISSDVYAANDERPLSFKSANYSENFPTLNCSYSPAPNSFDRMPNLPSKQSFKSIAAGLLSSTSNDQ